jgi:hypothetical protein
MTNSNPLIAKYEEIYGKKEKPKPQKPPIVEYFDEVGSTPSQEVIEKLRQLQPNSNIISASNASVSITPKPLVSYDVDSGKDSFLQIAEKVKNREAQVTSMSMERDIMSGTSITFEVRMWDTP